MNFIVPEATISVTIIMDETALHETGNKTCLFERSLFMWLWKNGQSVRCIAKQTGRSPTTVRRWVRRLQKEEYLQTRLFRMKQLMPLLTFPLNNEVDLYSSYEKASPLDSVLHALYSKILANYYNEYQLSLSRSQLPIRLKEPTSLKQQQHITHRKPTIHVFHT